MITELIQTNEHSVLIAAVCVLLGLTLYGHARGFVRMAVSLGAAVISLFLVRWILPYVTGAARESGFLSRQAERISAGLFAPGAETEYSAFYEILGLDRMAEATGEYLAGIILNVICFLILFILVNLLLKVASHFLNMLMKLPVLCGINQLGGAAVGFLEGVFYLWIFMIGVAFTPTAQFSAAVLLQIFSEPFLLWLYRNNLLLHVLAGIFGI